MSTVTKILVGIGIVTLIIVVGAAFMFGGKDKKEEAKINKPLMGEKISDMGSIHVKKGESHVAYNSNPPTSGPHWGDGVAGGGIHDKEVPDELLVHSLEHGATIVSYKPDLSQGDMKNLKNAFNDASGLKIMVPRKNLDVPIALTSWNYLLKLKTTDAGKIKAFIETNSDRAPEIAPI